VVETGHSKDNERSGDGGKIKIPLDNYTKLFDGYLYYFANSLKPDSVEHVIGDSLVKKMVAATVSVNGLGEINLSVSPWNYASLFREQLKFFEFREAIPPPAGRKEWDSYSDDQNPIDQLYYQIGDQVRANLRSYFSDRRRLESFYRTKKHLIREVVREKVPLTLRSRFISEIDRVIGSFQVVLKPGYRRTFDSYLDVERRYIAERYGDVPEKEMTIYFQNIYDQHNGPVKSIYPTFSERDRVQERPVGRAQEEKLAAARKALFDQSPNAKAAAFAYRRYLEGGEELVEGYIAILKDLRNSVFVD
jgi:hypothetical protein